MLEEVNERASRERNAVMHRCPESSDADAEQAKRDDLDGIQDLFNELGLRDMRAKDVLMGWRRLGKKEGDNDRSLLVIFKAKADRDRLLDRAPRLSRNPADFYKNINIVPDLTLKQRNMEKEMFKNAEQNNLQRNTEQK